MSRSAAISSRVAFASNGPGGGKISRPPVTSAISTDCRPDRWKNGTPSRLLWIGRSGPMSWGRDRVSCSRLWTLAIRARRDRTTPRGRPVVPEVKMMVAGSSSSPESSQSRGATPDVGHRSSSRRAGTERGTPARRFTSVATRRGVSSARAVATSASLHQLLPSTGTAPTHWVAHHRTIVSM